MNERLVPYTKALAGITAFEWTLLRHCIDNHFRLELDKEKRKCEDALTLPREINLER